MDYAICPTINRQAKSSFGQFGVVTPLINLFGGKSGWSNAIVDSLGNPLDLYSAYYSLSHPTDASVCQPLYLVEVVGNCIASPFSRPGKGLTPVLRIISNGMHTIVSPLSPLPCPLHCHGIIIFLIISISGGTGYAIQNVHIYTVSVLLKDLLHQKDSIV